MRDLHHLLHTKNHWTATKEAQALRSMYVYPLEREIHENLHRDVPPVPLLGYYALSSVLREVNPIKNPSYDLNELTGALERSSRHYKCHPIERELAELAIESIELQKPYLGIENNMAVVIDLAAYRK